MNSAQFHGKNLLVNMVSDGKTEINVQNQQISLSNLSLKQLTTFIYWAARSDIARVHLCKFLLEAIRARVQTKKVDILL